MAWALQGCSALDIRTSPFQKCRILGTLAENTIPSPAVRWVGHGTCRLYAREVLGEWVTFDGI